MYDSIIILGATATGKTGIAIDYANLAMVERKCGNMSDARKNLETALKYAENTDKDLYTKIKDALD